MLDSPPAGRPFVLLAHGDDALQLDEAVAGFAQGIEAVDRTDLVPDRSPDEAVIERALMASASVPLLGGTHLAVLHQPIRAAGRSPAAAAHLLGLVERLPPGAALALVELRPSRDMARPPAVLQRLAQAVRAGGGSVEERASPRRGELVAWIRRRGEQRAIAIEPRAAAVLAERVGGAAWEGDVERGEQTRLADAELGKLATYAAGRTVTIADVEALVAEARPPSIFAITNAIDRRDRSAAAAALDRALRDGEPPLKILAALAGRLSDLVVARDLLSARATPADVSRRLGRGGARGAERLIEAARRYSGAELEAMLRGLLEADVAIKSHAAEPDDALATWLGTHVLARPARPSG